MWKKKKMFQTYQLLNPRSLSLYISKFEDFELNCLRNKLTFIKLLNLKMIMQLPLYWVSKKYRTIPVTLLL